MTPTATPRRSEQSTDKTAIRPFQVTLPDADLTELRQRIVATRFPEKEAVADDTQGVQLATIQKLARYWATEHDWRKVEAKMNSYPHFITEIDGLDIHLHSRSLETRECAAAHRHPRLAWLDHRAAQDHRAADQSDGPRRGAPRTGSTW